MGNSKIERMFILIDGGNFYHNTKGILKGGSKFPFRKFIDEMVRNRELVKTSYYIAPLDYETNPKKYWAHQKFLTELRKIPKFDVVLCSLKKIRKKDGTFEFIVKGDDALLIRDLLVGAFKDLYDTAIIVSGDEDFAPVIKTVQELGKKVGNAYFKSSSSQALRQVCDFSIPLDKMISIIINSKDKEDSALPEDHTESINRSQ